MAVQKTCSLCKRKVNETIHTQETYKVDYYTYNQGDKDTVKVVCIDCYNRGIGEIGRHVRLRGV